MKFTLLGDDGIRLEPVPGPMTIEAESPDQQYSPFHMLASSLAFCTYSVLASWASNAKIGADDLAIEVTWVFAENPHRVDEMEMKIEWPSLPASREGAANRVADMCAVHASLANPPKISTTVKASDGTAA